MLPTPALVTVLVQEFLLLEGGFIVLLFGLMALGNHLIDGGGGRWARVARRRAPVIMPAPRAAAGRKRGAVCAAGTMLHMPPSSAARSRIERRPNPATGPKRERDLRSGS